MKRCVDVLCLDAEHIDRFLNQLNLGLPFVMTDGLAALRYCRARFGRV